MSSIGGKPKKGKTTKQLTDKSKTNNLKQQQSKQSSIQVLKVVKQTYNKDQQRKNTEIQIESAKVESIKTISCEKKTSRIHSLKSKDDQKESIILSDQQKLDGKHQLQVEAKQKEKQQELIIKQNDSHQTKVEPTLQIFLKGNQKSVEHFDLENIKLESNQYIEFTESLRMYKLIKENSQQSKEIFFNLKDQIKKGNQDEETLKSITKLQVLFKKDLFNIIDYFSCFWLKEHIISNQSKQSIQRGLYDILQIIIDGGISQIPLSTHHHLFIPFKVSGLLDLIEANIHSSIKSKKLDRWKYSDSVLKQLNNLCLIMKGTKIEKDLFQICVEAFDSNMQKFTEKFSKRKQSEQLTIENEKMKQKENRKIQLKMISALKMMTNLANYKNKNRLNSNQEKINKIIQLFHINCSDKLNCNFKLELRQSALSDELQTSAIWALSQLSQCLLTIKESLIHDHNAISHICPLIIKFANKQKSNQLNISEINLNSSNNKINLTNNKQTQSNSSPQLISAILNLLHVLLINEPKAAQQFQSIHKSVQSLINLSRFMLDQNQNKQQLLLYGSRIDQNMPLAKWNAVSIRIRSLDCLGWIQIFSTDKQQKKINIEKQYVKCALIPACSNCGGSQEENNGVVNSALLKIIMLILVLRKGKKDFCSAKLNLLKIVEEQIIEEGAQDEFQSLLFPDPKQRFSIASRHTYWLINQILNRFNDKSRSPRHY